MKITINGFKCYDQITYELKDGALTLIRGPSGSGKSSIFHAITWALYGNLRGVDSRLNPKGKLNVTLELPTGIKIYRQKRPGLLVVTINEAKYEDASAQAIIYRTVIGAALWPVVGCIAQGEINSLLSASNNERLDMLNKLAFNEDPGEIDKHIEVIEQALINTTTTLKTEQIVLEQETLEYHRYLQQYPAISETLILTDKTLRQTQQTRLNQQQELRIQLEAQYRLSGIALGIVNNLRQDLDRLQIRIEANKNCPTEHQVTSQLLLQAVQRQQQLREALNQQRMLTYVLKAQNEIQSQIVELKQLHQSKVSRYVPVTLTFTEGNYHEAVQKESLYASQLQRAQELKVTYDAEAVKTLCYNLEQRLQLQGQVKEHERYLQMKQVEEALIKRLIGRDSTVTPESLRGLELQIYQFQTSNNTLLCPHCHQGLRFIDGRLVPQDTPNLTLINTKLAELTQKLHLDKETLNILYELNQVRNALSHFSSTIISLVTDKAKLSVKEENEIIRQLEQLRQLQIVTLPKVSSKQIAGVLEQQKLQNEIIDLERQLKILEYKLQEGQKQIMVISAVKLIGEVNIDNLNTQLEVAERDVRDLSLKQNASLTAWGDYKYNLVQRKELQGKLKQEEKRIIVGIESKLENCQTEIKKLEQSLIEYDRNDALYQKQQRTQELGQRVETRKFRVTALSRRLGNLVSMKDLAIKTECTLLDNLVNSLNVTIADLASFLFDDPIAIKISLFKTVKSTSRIKPNVNLMMTYKGADFDSVTGLSGGERDRVSLLLTLAMNKVSGCPFLFLDETLGSMDPTKKEVAIKSIKHNTRGKTCVIICHSSVAGTFDDTIEVVT